MSNWIPIRHDLFDDPSVLQMSAITGDTPEATVGYLAKVWCWADRNMVMSRICHADVTLVSRMIGTERAKAMVDVGWLRECEHAGARTLVLPNIDRWIAQSSKQRLLAARRQAHKRRHASVTHKRDKSVTTEQQNSSVLLEEEASSAPESRTEHLPLSPRTAAEIGKHPGAAAALLSALHGGLVPAEPVGILVKAKFRAEQAQQFAKRHGLTIGAVLERLEWAAARDWMAVRDGGKPIGSLGGWLRNSFERNQGRPARWTDWRAAMKGSP